jgi:hypothetical protein
MVPNADRSDVMKVINRIRGKLTGKLDSILNSEEIKRDYVYEGATGKIKFGDSEPIASADYILLADKELDVVKVKKIDYKYVERELVPQTDFVIWHGSDKQEGGRSGYRLRFFLDNYLKENVLDKAKDIWEQIKGLFVKVWDAIKDTLDKGTEAFFDFIEYEPHVSFNNEIEF